ncbi:MAG: MaoC family dehydratase N-terminal domain-containing protein [Myxococcota bacterium]
MTTVNLKDWIGRTQRVEDELSPWTSAAVAAMLDRKELDTQGGASLRPLWQWFYFLGTVSQEELGSDGHPKRGGFMPPVPLPRRMFAGARMEFHAPLVLGQPASRIATIKDVKEKSGRSGKLAFVTVNYELRQKETLCITEEQDIVYKEPGAPVSAPKPIPLPEVPAGSWSRDVRVDSRMLFRFSALTFNAHRIHYDRPYAQTEEGYPGLVVHGPLTAVLLADLVHTHTTRPIRSFSFRGKAPLFDLSPFRLQGHLNGDSVTLEAFGPDGNVTLSAVAGLG